MRFLRINRGNVFLQTCPLPFTQRVVVSNSDCASVTRVVMGFGLVCLELGLRLGDP